ncbi:hypothetical protein OG788_46670 [Streptomyces sp. NBC_00647]|uniref:VMAP-C domain-containing protein n=1 Tax=Streptomyces sp. NBC_00647 TaxID=2975796 RepID=UPI00324461C6
MGEFENASGLALLSGLTDALCGLSCMRQPRGRQLFAEVLAEQLGVHIASPDTGLRGDALCLVRAALSVAGGEQILASVVGLFEGPAAAEGIEQITAPVAGPYDSAPQLAGPLSERDVASARALLSTMTDELPWTALRDGIAAETGLSPPLGLPPVGLLLHLLEWNVQPDGLPPAVLLMEHAAAAVRAPNNRGALSAWAEDWASRAGLLTELEHRRAARAATRTGHPVPRCLLVIVEPARDGSDDVTVRPWLNTSPDSWNPLPAEPTITTLDQLGMAVSAALRQLARLSPPENDPFTGPASMPPYVEFVLPYDLLNRDVAGLASESGRGESPPLGLRYGVHLRSLERMRTRDPLVVRRWRERWRTLQSDGIGVYEWKDPDTRRPAEWRLDLAREPHHTAAVLDAPDREGAMNALKAAIAEGIGLAMWDRRGEFLDERREVVRTVLASVQPPQIPMAVHRLRRSAAAHQHDARLLGRHIGFLWDDPTRLVDNQDADMEFDVETLDREENGT